MPQDNIAKRKSNCINKFKQIYISGLSTPGVDRPMLPARRKKKMKLTIIFIILTIAIIGFVISCNQRPKEKSDKELFEEILNDSRINSREVGEGEGIKFFQVMENGKTGFRDLDGNIVIKPEFESAEMFSEGFSAVEIKDKWGLIDEKGKYIIEPKYEYLGSMRNGLMSFREEDKYGFINLEEEVIIKPQFDWVGGFSEEMCVFRNDNGENQIGKYGFVDKEGKIAIHPKFDYADKFENGRAKAQLGKDWIYIDFKGEIIKNESRR